MATVKGDVHDIGKNIVGVVLQCNNYEVIDLGVMVPADRILDEAVARKVDIVGLSGLITPSLDEMVFVACEMERRGFAIPLLIGGATTSRTHTAVKIEPAYHAGSTTYVLDASRAVGVVSSLLSDTEKDRVEAATREEYARIREQFARGQEAKVRTPLAAARANRFAIDWQAYAARQRPSFIGARAFAAMGPAPTSPATSTGRRSSRPGSWSAAFPAILEDDVVGEAARDLYADAQAMLDQHRRRALVRGRAASSACGRPTPTATTSSSGPTRPAPSSAPACTPCASRWPRREGRANAALADFVAPMARRRLDRRLRGHRRPRRGGARGALQGRRRRLFGDPRRRPGRPPGRGLRRGPAPQGPHRALGLCAGRAIRSRRPAAPNATAASAPRPAIRPSPTTPKRRPCSTCWTPSAATGIELTESYAMTPPASVSRPLLRPPRSPLFRRRQDRARPGRGLCAAARAGT